jgi:poly [ADP-ribose] polymerase
MHAHHVCLTLEVGTTMEGKDRVGIMFLVEAALGKEHHITRDDSSLRAAPKGFDSIIAKGSGEPDPAKDTTLKIDGHDVTVPQGKRINMPQYAGSSFDKVRG